VAASLGADLVFQVDASHAGFFEHANRVEDVDRVAIAGVRVRGQGDVDRAGEHAAMVHILGQAHDADIRNTQQRVRQGGATRAGRLEAGSRHQSQAVAVVNARGNNEFIGVKKLSQFTGSADHIGVFSTNTQSGCAKVVTVRIIKVRGTKCQLILRN